MKLSRIKREDFSDWNTYYWTYQYILAEQYYLPRLKLWGVEIENKKILDIGCGDGGFTSAFGRAGGFCTGVEIREFNWNPSDNVKYIVMINRLMILNRIFCIIKFSAETAVSYPNHANGR